MTISSTWAAIHCWPLGLFPELERYFGSSCRFAHYLRRRPWPAYRTTLRRSDAQEMKINGRFKKARTRQKKLSYDNLGTFDASSQTECYAVRG